jgi:hypothetical protein
VRRVMYENSYGVGECRVVLSFVSTTTRWGKTRRIETLDAFLEERLPKTT